MHARPSDKGKTFGSQDGKVRGSGLLAVGRWTFGLNYVFGGQNYNYILIALGGLRVGENFEVNFEDILPAKLAVQRFHRRGLLAVCLTQQHSNVA